MGLPRRLQTSPHGVAIIGNDPPCGSITDARAQSIEGVTERRVEDTPQGVAERHLRDTRSPIGASRVQRRQRVPGNPMLTGITAKGPVSFSSPVAPDTSIATNPAGADERSSVAE